MSSPQELPLSSLSPTATPPTNEKSYSLTSLFKKKNSSAFAKQDRKWRWWHPIAIAMTLLVITQVFVIRKSFSLLDHQLSSTRIGKT
jgi:hypothetical protein